MIIYAQIINDVFNRPYQLEYFNMVVEIFICQIISYKMNPHIISSAHPLIIITKFSKPQH
jgi:hypothetical protein